MSVVVDEMDAIFKRLKREQHDEQSQRYAFPNDAESYVATLRALPFSCRLWQAFRRFDEARRAYATATAQRQARLAELRTLGHRIAEAAGDDRVSDAEWSLLTARRERLTVVLDDPHNAVGELKTASEHAEAAWGKVWEGYRATVQTLHRQQQRRIDDPVSRSDQWQVVQQLEEQKRALEAPQGGTA